MTNIRVTYIIPVYNIDEVNNKYKYFTLIVFSYGCKLLH